MSLIRTLTTKLLRLWVNAPTGLNHRMYRACLILRRFRPHPHDGLCRNLDDLVDDQSSDCTALKKLDRAIALWPSTTGSLIYPIPPLGYRLLPNTVEGAAKAYNLAAQSGDLYNTSCSYGVARMLLLDHLTQHFEMLWLINEED